MIAVIKEVESVTTYNCRDLEQAMIVAQNHVARAAHIFIWPITPTHWLVIVRWPVLLN